MTYDLLNNKFLGVISLDFFKSLVSRKSQQGYTIIKKKDLHKGSEFL